MFKASASAPASAPASGPASAPAHASGAASAPASVPASAPAPAVEHGKISNVMTAAAPQTCLGTSTSAADTAHPEVTV